MAEAFREQAPSCCRAGVAHLVVVLAALVLAACAGRVEAPVAEFRVYFGYKLGAWYGNDKRQQGVRVQDDDRVLPAWWKRTPWLQGLESTVSYRTRVLYSTPLGNR